MNKLLSPTCVFALAFLMLAAIQIEASPHFLVRVTVRTPQQQKPATKAAKSYACPMHPEVKSTRKGKCPKCKMDLQVVREITSSADKESLVASVAVAGIVTPDVNTSGAAGNVMGPTKKMIIPDVDVLDQEGNPLHFYSDLIKGKTVAINFIFTNCTTICPPLAATFARVQKDMGDKAGKDVHFISISVDPLTDTPERLKAWGAKFKAGPGWTFITGEKQEMDKLLNAFGAAVSKREDHTPAMIIGNDAKGVWTRTYGLAKTGQIVGLILDVMAGKVEETSATEEAKP